MICDFNISYSDVSFGRRASLAVCHAAYVLPHLIKAIVDIAKMVFFSLTYLLTFGRAEAFKGALKLAGMEYMSSITNCFLSLYGVLAPVNAGILQVNAMRFLISGFGNGTGIFTSFC